MKKITADFWGEFRGNFWNKIFSFRIYNDTLWGSSLLEKWKKDYAEYWDNEETYIIKNGGKEMSKDVNDSIFQRNIKRGRTKE